MTTPRKIAKGVTERFYPSGKSAYMIVFSFRSVTCKETLKNLPVTRANDKYAINLKAEIDSRIARATFKYTDYFPDSPNARKFGHAVSTVTVGELLSNWLKDIKRSAPHSTYNSYRRATTNLIKQLGNHRAVDLVNNPEPIKEMIRAQTITRKSISNNLIPLRSAFDIAMNDNVIDRNPMDKIKVKLLVPRTQVAKPEPDPYSPTEILQLLDACEKYRPEWKPYWQFIFFSGVRTSEGYALKWANIDWNKETLFIDSATVEKIEKETKTKSSTRHLPLLPMALAALKEQKEYSATFSDYIFIGATKEPIIAYKETANILKYLCKKTGLRFREQRQTRHSFASNMLSGGENPYFVAKTLGHKTVEMVIRVYGTWINQAQDKKQEYISEFAKMQTQNCTSTARGKTETKK